MARPARYKEVVNRIKDIENLNDITLKEIAKELKALTKEVSKNLKKLSAEGPSFFMYDNYRGK
jgi:DNA-binding MarR family transcriptional regulator